MSIVYVLGAGASFGEDLAALDVHCPHSTITPPIITGFFSGDLLEKLNLDIGGIKNEFEQLLRWTMATCLATQNQNFGEGEWKTLNVEDVFTRLEICREFESPSGRAGAALLGIRNDLLDYIRRIIGLCTRNARGTHYHTLVDSLIRPDDSLITFNWDLLLDDCFLDSTRGLTHYGRFLERMGALDDRQFTPRGEPGDGIFLKLHGSLNWFHCTNPICAGAGRVIFRNDTQSCLAVSLGSERCPCRRCGSDSAPLIIPPVLRKPITEQETVRAVWGLARTVLRNADVIVIIGFSAAPTDFYASWLLHEAVNDPMFIGEALGRKKTVIIVNPFNDSSRKEHDDFKSRMLKLFPRGYMSDFMRFSQIHEICERAKVSDPSKPIERNPRTQAPPQ